MKIKTGSKAVLPGLIEKFAARMIRYPRMPGIGSGGAVPEAGEADRGAYGRTVQESVPFIMIRAVIYRRRIFRC